MTKFVSYKQWLFESITPKVNKHMTHAEDLVLSSGYEGVNWVISMFKSLYDKLQGNTEENKIQLSVKFDGAPSVFVWSKFNELDKPGLAIKALFAKDKKLIFNDDDVDRYYTDQKDLNFKLKSLLKYIPSLHIPEDQIWQGDFLFDKNSLKDEGKQYSFHPNTIVYKVDKDSDIGQKIGKSDVGVVWHTRYIGTSLEDIYAQYNIRASELPEHPKVFMTDPYIPSLAGYVTFTDEESENFIKHINNIEGLSKNLYNDPNYNIIQKDNEIISFFTIFQNSLIRDNVHINNSKEIYKKFIDFVTYRYKKEIDAKKTDKGKNVTTEKMNSCLSRLSNLENTFYTIIDLILEIVNLKNIFIEKLNNAGKFQNYLQTIDGKYISTGEEGFAISDIEGNIIKLVDRYEFSFSNFSPNIKKGWVK